MNYVVNISVNLPNTCVLFVELVKLIPPKLNKPELDTRHDWNNANPKQLPGSGITGEDLDKMAKEYYSKSNTEK